MKVYLDQNKMHLFAPGEHGENLTLKATLAEAV